MAGGSFPCHPNSGDQADSTFSLGNISGHMEEDRDMAVSHSSCLLSPEENMLLSFIFHRPKQVTRQCLISWGQGGMILGRVQQEESWLPLCSSDDDHRAQNKDAGVRRQLLYSATPLNIMPGGKLESSYDHLCSLGVLAMFFILFIPKFLRIK